MRLLGIDYGSKRVGIALTDESGVMAFPHSVLKNDGDMVGVLEKLIADEGVVGVVIGHSIDLDGRDNAVQSGVIDLIGDLTLATGLPIELEPEQYTTQAALRIQGRTEKTDASAAALILEGYIAKNKHKA